MFRGVSRLSWLLPRLATAANEAGSPVLSPAGEAWLLLDNVANARLFPFWTWLCCWLLAMMAGRSEDLDEEAPSLEADTWLMKRADIARGTDERMAVKIYQLNLVHIKGREKKPTHLQPSKGC